jgi:TP901 family phage tail tape measure protein
VRGYRMAETVKRIGVLFEAKFDKDSFDEISKKFKSLKGTLSGLNVGNLKQITPTIQALVSQLSGMQNMNASMDKLSDAIVNLGKGSVSINVTDAALKGFTKTQKGTSDESKKLITLVKELEYSFAKLDIRDAIDPNKMELFHGKWKAINAQVEKYVAILAKETGPDMVGLQKRAVNIARKIDDELNRLSETKKAAPGADISVHKDKIQKYLGQLKGVGLESLDKTISATKKELQAMGVSGSKSAAQVDKLKLSLLELGKANQLISTQITNVKERFNNTSKESANYTKKTQQLNKTLADLMVTQASVNKVMASTRETIIGSTEGVSKAIQDISKLKAELSSIGLSKIVAPRGIADIWDAWTAVNNNIANYIKKLSSLASIPLTEHEGKVLAKDTEIMAKFKELETLRMTAGPDDPKVQKLSQEIQKLIGDYQQLSKVMLTDAIDKVTLSLQKLGIVVGMEYGQIRKLRLGALDLAHAEGLLRLQLNQTEAAFRALDPAAANYKQRVDELNATFDKQGSTLTAVSTALKVKSQSTADAARSLRMYAEGFIPMMKSQAAWLAGGAILFGTMYKIQDAIRGFLSFEDRLNRIRIIGEGTTEQMKMLRSEMLHLAEAAGQVPQDLAEAAFFLAKYGLSVEQVTNSLPALTRLTEVAGGTIQENAKGTIAIMNAYGIAFENTASVTNKLAVTLNKSALEMEDLSSIISTVASSAALFNQPIEQLFGLAAAMSNLGVKSSTIGTSLRQLFSVLAQAEAPTERFNNVVIKALDRHNISLSELNPSYKSIIEILNTFNRAGIKTIDLFKALQIRVAGNTATMINALPALTDLANEIKTQNVLMKQFSETTKSADVSLRQLQATLNSTIATILGSETESGLSNFIKLINSILQAIRWLFEGLQGTITRIGLLVIGLSKFSKPIAGLLEGFGVISKIIKWIPGWVGIIAILISALTLTSKAMGRLSKEESEYEKIKKGFESRKDEIKTLRERIRLNNEMADANMVERKSIDAKNAALEKEIELKEKLNEAERQKIIKQTIERAGEEARDVTTRLQLQGRQRGTLPGITPKEISIESIINRIAEERARDESKYKAIRDLVGEDLSKHAVPLELQEILDGYNKLAATKAEAQEAPQKALDAIMKDMRIEEGQRERKLEHLEMERDDVDDLVRANLELVEAKETLGKLESIRQPQKIKEALYAAYQAVDSDEQRAAIMKKIVEISHEYEDVWVKEEDVESLDKAIQKENEFILGKEIEIKKLKESRREHGYNMEAIEEQRKSLVKQNEAYTEQEKIAAKIEEKVSELVRVTKRITETKDVEKRNGLLATQAGIVSDLINLNHDRREISKQSIIDDIDHIATLREIGSEYKISEQSLFRIAKLQEELNMLEATAADIEAKKKTITTEDEKRENEVAARKNELDILLKKLDIEQEIYDDMRRYYDLSIFLQDQSIEKDKQEIDLRKDLTDREKELQKLMIDSAAIQGKMLKLIQLIKQAQISGFDPSVVEDLKKELYELEHSLGMVERTYEDINESERGFWEGFKEHIVDGDEAWRNFTYNMGKNFASALGGMIADLGKAFVYMNRDAKKALQDQREETLLDAKKTYDENKNELINSLNTGQLTYAQYYEKLGELDDNYREKVNDAQKDYEDRMAESTVTIANLWEKLWRKMVDIAIEAMAQMAMSNMKGGGQDLLGMLGSLFRPGGGVGTGGAPVAGAPAGGAVMIHTGGLVSDITRGLKAFHSGGLSSDEILAKLQRNEYVMSARAVNALGVGTLDYMNKTGQSPEQTLNIYNVADITSVPQLSPDDVVNVVSFDISRKGRIYKTMTIKR